MKSLSILLATLFCANAYASAAPTLAGDTIDAGMYRTVDTGKGIGRIVGFGLDAPFVVADGVSDLKRYSVAFELDVDGGKFALDFINPSQWGAGIVLRLSGLDFASAQASQLSSLSVDTNLVGYTLNVGRDFVELGLAGVKGTRDSYFNASFNVSSVPEPSSYAMLGLGLGALGFAARRAKRKARA
jgi:hypothetical protein